MRKLLISVLIVVLLAVAGYMCYEGMTIVNFKISGIKEIEQLNKSLDSQITVASRLISNDYPTELSNLSKSLKELKTEKENYNNLVSISTDEQVQTATKFEKYEIESVWVMIGNHAKKEGVTMQLVLSTSSTGTANLYDLNFTVTGQYVGIADFIYDIENDSKLGFKIENFDLKPNETTNTLTGKFTCKDISININSANVSYQSTEQITQTDTTNAKSSTNSNANSSNTVE